MAHMCEECGQMCGCDGEDTMFDDQPWNCRHLADGAPCSLSGCEEIDDFEEED